jgi:hypothetical protein
MSVVTCQQEKLIERISLRDTTTARLLSGRIHGTEGFCWRFGDIWHHHGFETLMTAGEESFTEEYDCQPKQSAGPK